MLGKEGVFGLGESYSQRPERPFLELFFGRDQSSSADPPRALPLLHRIKGIPETICARAVAVGNIGVYLQQSAIVVTPPIKSNL